MMYPFSIDSGISLAVLLFSFGLARRGRLGVFSGLTLIGIRGIIRWVVFGGFSIRWRLGVFGGRRRLLVLVAITIGRRGFRRLLTVLILLVRILFAPPPGLLILL